MIQYVTVADVDAALGPDWADAGEKDEAVLQANAYLNTLTFKAWDTQPDAVTTAGVYLAKDAAAGNLFADTDGELKRKYVKAEGVESEKEYQDGSVARSGTMQLIDALLSPWVEKASVVQIVRRL